MVAAAPMQWLPVHAQAPGLYAGFWRRVVAWFIDALVLSALHALVAAALRAPAFVPWAAADWGYGLGFAPWIGSALRPYGLVLAWLYFAVCEASRWQATPGKLALALVVTDEYGRRIGFARATGRFFGKFVSALMFGVGFLLAGWTARKQALHDFMAGCCVVRRGGLAAWEASRQAGAEAGAAAPARPPVGMPAWAVALLVLAVCAALILPITAFVTAIGIPLYRGYAVRAQVAHGVAATERARALVAEYIGQRGALPDSNRALGLPQPEALQARYVASVRIAGGKVVITYGNAASAAIRGGHVVMSPSGAAARLHWQCSSPDIVARYLPSNCR